MKLKKIASLALAGVMAVSMLTACGDTVSEQPTQPEQPTTTTGVVSAVEAGIKSWNSSLKIDVKSSSNMDAAIEKVFDTNTDWKTLNGTVVSTLDYVFGLDHGFAWYYDGGYLPLAENYGNASFVANDKVIKLLKNTDVHSNYYIEDGDTIWSYAIVEVTKANGDANVAAGNVIGEALQSLSNTVAIRSTDNNGLYTYMNVDYTMYVTSEDAVKANNSTVDYVIAVLKADYSAVV